MISFWSDRWIDGMAPCSIAPDLFPLARRKKASLRSVMQDGRWMKGLQRLSSTEQLVQFLNMWQSVQNVVFSEDPDSVRWKFNANGRYSASSAYECQFLGRIRKPLLLKAWILRWKAR